MDHRKSLNWNIKLIENAMTLDDIKKLIASDESRTLELKKTTGELKDGMHSACAFLNTEGGWLIFGVAPKSLKIIGQEVTDNTQREIAQALAGIDPAVDVHIEYVDVPDYPGNKIIAMHFDGWVWGERPHTFHGCPYYKIESTTKVMPHDMYDERIRAHQPQLYSWEGQTADSVTLADLNEKHIRGCIRRRGRSYSSKCHEYLDRRDFGQMEIAEKRCTHKWCRNVVLGQH